MKAKIIYFLFLAFLAGNLKAQNYTKIMGKAIKNAIGIDTKKYQCFSLPTDNFGIATSYYNSTDDFICDMWDCIGIANPPADLDSWIKFNGLTGPGKGGTLNLSQETQNSVGFSAVLPKIYSVLGINVDVSKKTHTNVNVAIGKVYWRQLRKGKMENFINGIQPGSDGSLRKMKQAFNDGKLVMVVSDYIIDDLSVDVTVDDAVDAALDAKLGANATKIFSDESGNDPATLHVTVSKTAKGHYSYKVSSHVVFAVEYRKQPKAGTLGAGDDWSEWTSVNDPKDPSMEKVRRKKSE